MHPDTDPEAEAIFRAFEAEVERATRKAAARALTRLRALDRRRDAQPSRPGGQAAPRAPSAAPD